MDAKKKKSVLQAPKSVNEWIRSNISSTTNHGTLDPNIGFVEALYQTCSTIFICLWGSRFRSMPYGPRKNTLKKDIAQLRLWEENFPPNRLDIILEYSSSSRLKMNVIENLYEIGKILMQYCRESVSSVENQSTLTQDLVHELEILLEKATIILSDEERPDSSSDESSSDESSSTIEFEQNRYGRLHCYISCMIDLAPVIEKQISSLQYKMERRAPPLENAFHLSQSAQPFAMRIKDRFRDASISLVERLAQANWERSIRIRQQELEGLSAEDHHDVAALFQPYSVFHDSGLGTYIPTKSQYAATNASHTSFLSAAGEESQGRPRVPPLPSEGEHGCYFQCTYCRKSISMKSRVEWKVHVFADLQSYICTHENCKDPLKMFPSRKLWADHEFNKHFSQLQWRCFICHMIMVTQQSFVDHLIINHRIMMTGHRLAAVTSEAKETVLLLDFANYQCPLCSQSGWKTRKGYEIHIGQHLEEISLASISTYEEYEDSDTDSNLDTSHNASMEGRRQQLAVQKARHQLSAQQQNSHAMVQANGMDKGSEDRQSSQDFRNETQYTSPTLIGSSIGTQAEVPVPMPMTTSTQETSTKPAPSPSSNIIIHIGSPPPSRKPFIVNPAHFSSNNTSANEADDDGDEEEEIEDFRLPSPASPSGTNQLEQVNEEVEDDDDDDDDALEAEMEAAFEEEKAMRRQRRYTLLSDDESEVGKEE